MKTEQQKAKEITDYLTKRGWEFRWRNHNWAFADRVFTHRNRPTDYIALSLCADGTGMPSACGWEICGTAWNDIKSLGPDLESLKRGMRTWRI